MSTSKNQEEDKARRADGAQACAPIHEGACPGTSHGAATTESVRVCTNAPTANFTGDFLWKCRLQGCGETIFFPNEDGHVIAFLILHHLVRKHGFTKEETLAHDPGLEGATAEYVGLASESQR